ncbi:putative GDP-fucose protein O-fucosyltransferase 2 [Cryptosporidium serpentis]
MWFRFGTSSLLIFLCLIFNILLHLITGNFAIQEQCTNIYDTWIVYVSRVCPSWMQEIVWILYDVKYGEGFYMQKDVFYRMALTVAHLNNIKQTKQYQQNNQTHVLVLPPFCNIAHWSYRAKRRLKWSLFFNIQQWESPTIEYDIFSGLHQPIYTDDLNIKNSSITAIYLSFDWNDKQTKRDYNIERVSLDISNENSTQKYIKCDMSSLKRQYNVRSTSYSGNCNRLLLEEVYCIHFTKTLTSETLSIALKNLFHNPITENKWRSSLRSVIIKFADNILVPWSYELSKYNLLNSLEFSTYIENKAMVYMKLHSLDSQKFIGIHIRRGDFVYFYKDEVPSFKNISLRVSKLMKELNISKVVVSTDAENNDLKKMKTSLELIADIDFHFLGDIPNLTHKEDGLIAAIHQYIILQSDYFVGTKESRFTFSIRWQRIVNGKNLDSSTEYFCSNSEYEAKKDVKYSDLICREHTDRLPVTLISKFKFG